MNHVVIELFKLHPDVPDPHYGTSYSACFDLHFFPTTPITFYNEYNIRGEKFVDNQNTIWIHPGDRVLVPTGLVAKIKDPIPQYSIRLHARSGLALKNGLVLANAEGVVDVDYQEQIFAMMTNISSVIYVMKVGERICQAEVVSNYTAYWQFVSEKPKQLTERAGGFGSTGV